MAVRANFVRGGWAVALGASVFLAGCGGAHREARTEAQLNEELTADTTAFREVFTSGVAAMIERQQRELKEYKEGKTSEEPVMDIIGFSGGGDYGAFGAGFMMGWREITDPAWKLPEFDVVTGVSTGSLISPFVFLGTEKDLAEIDHLYRNPKSDWATERGLLFFMPGNLSLMEIKGLKRDIDAAVNEEFIKRIADQSSTGRILLVSATNVDMGTQRMWNMVVEAQRAIDAGNMEIMREKLLASSAIPGVFPPIEIGPFFYADGGVTANVLLPLDAHSPHSLINVWKREHPDVPLPKVRYWIIENNQSAQVPKTAQPTWVSVAGASLGTSIRSATMAQVRLLVEHANYANLAAGTRVEVRFVSIPNDWRAPVEGTFKEETMRSLADLGRKLGKDPGSWKLLSLPLKE